MKWFLLSGAENLFFVLVFDVVPFVETVDTTIRGREFLLSGEERMTIGAGIHAEFLRGRASHEGVSAGAAGHCHLIIFRMNAVFHCFSPSAMIFLLIVSFQAKVLYQITLGNASNIFPLRKRPPTVDFSREYSKLNPS